MRLLAGLSGAVSVYLLVGLLTGHAPRSLTRRRSRPRPEDSRLRQAGLSVTSTQFFAASVLAAGVTLMVVWVLSGAWTVGLAPALAVATLPRAWLAREAKRIAERRVAAWPDALRDLVSRLEAPMSLHRGLVELGRTGPEPLRAAWQRYERLTAALDHRAALQAVQAELADPVSDRVITVLLVAHEQGSGVVLDVLRELADATAKDVRLHDEIETAQLERRIEARAAVVLLFGVLVLLCSSSPPYRDFYSTAAGLMVIFVGSAMALAGMAVISRLGRLPVERRVLVGQGSPES
ncbi:MAG TPA: type II secretion system F family protein [Acidimicrobiales bacterium]|nr:type II secretion system F family protein [Acidimicrobiales bacterium]